MTRASDTARLIGAGATINDGTTITTADNTTQLTLKSTDADASQGPVLDLHRDSASPADDDGIGRVVFSGENDASEKIDLIQFIGLNSDVTDGTEDGRLQLYIHKDGSSINRMDFQPTETTFNDDSADVDFRVESNGDANMLVVDAGNDRVGIGTGTPTATFHVSGDNPRGRFTDTPNSVDFDIFMGDDNATVGMSTNHALKFMTNDTELASFKSNGVLLVGTHSDTSGSERISISVTSGSTGGINIIPTGSSGTNTGIACRTTGGSFVGGIQFTSSGTSFPTSSDYRLKENIVTDWDATTRLKQLKPSRFNFKVEPDKTVDGFLAHEVSSIVPEAIHGEKDAVDKNGNIEPQGIDHSKLVPLLVKTIQELEARITTLESK